VCRVFGSSRHLVPGFLVCVGGGLEAVWWSLGAGLCVGSARSSWEFRRSGVTLLPLLRARVVRAARLEATASLWLVGRLGKA
jgi:hypothetical protein